jgi:hypothetical protein
LDVYVCWCCTHFFNSPLFSVAELNLTGLNYFTWEECSLAT